MSVEVRPYKGKKGCWEYDIKIRLPDGTEVRERKKSPCKGKEDSKRWADEREHVLQQLARSGELKRKEIPTVEEFWPRFLVGVMRARELEEGTIRVKTSHYRNWVRPHLGPMRLDAVGGEEVAKFTAVLREAKLGAGSISSILIIVRMMLETAREWQIIKDAPRVRGPKVPKPKAKVVAPAHYEDLLLAAERVSPEARALVLLAGEECMRVGEIMALMWDAVDFKTGTIHVKRNLYEGRLKEYTKNKGTRSFKATPRVLAALQVLPKERPDYIFVAPKGGPWATRRVWDVLKKVFKEAGMERRGPHAFRHCGTTRMGLADVPAAVMLQITGHANLGILQRYMHIEPGDTSIAVQRLANLAPGEPGEMWEKGKEGAVATLGPRRRRRGQEGL